MRRMIVAMLLVGLSVQWSAASEPLGMEAIPGQGCSDASCHCLGPVYGWARTFGYLHYDGTELVFDASGFRFWSAGRTFLEFDRLVVSFPDGQAEFVGWRSGTQIIFDVSGLDNQAFDLMTADGDRFPVERYCNGHIGTRIARIAGSQPGTFRFVALADGDEEAEGTELQQLPLGRSKK